jgi:hypothetical protein
MEPDQESMNTVKSLGSDHDIEVVDVVVKRNKENSPELTPLPGTYHAGTDVVTKDKRTSVKILGSTILVNWVTWNCSHGRNVPFSD